MSPRDLVYVGHMLDMVVTEDLPKLCQHLNRSSRQPQNNSAKVLAVLTRVPKR